MCWWLAMNSKMIVYTISRIMVFFASLMIIPVFIGLYYNENSFTILAFLKAMIISYIVFVPMFLVKPESKIIYFKEGFIITSVIWLLMAFFGGLPLFLSKQLPTLIDAYFEMASGLTTTGASVITDLTKISNPILFWRSFSHFIGGMGVLVLALAVLPEISPTSVQAMKAEVPGPEFGKLLPKLKSSARILYFIYVILTLILIIVLVIAKMPLFDAVNHAFATAGTGGFGIKNGSVAYYNSSAIEMVLAVGMLVFGVNFNLYYLVLIGRARDAIKSEELKAYLLIVLVATLSIFINISSSYENYLTALKDCFFTVSSLITTTGFATADFDSWPAFSRWVLLMVMFFGGCAGSTAGGLKISRVVVAFKSSINAIKKNVNPNRKVPLLFDGKALDKNSEKSIKSYFVLYFVLFGFLVFVTSVGIDDLITSFAAVTATFNNVGPGLGLVGPTGNYFHLTSFNKIFLSLVMITGRLEIFPVLIFFNPATWRQG